MCVTQTGKQLAGGQIEVTKMIRTHSNGLKLNREREREIFQCSASEPGDLRGST